MTKPPEPGGPPGRPTPSPQPRPAPKPAAPRPAEPKPAAPKPAAPKPAAPKPAAPKPALAQPTAVLDQAHLGDIEGALGRIKVDEEHRSGWRRRLLTFLPPVGPSLISMLGDTHAAASSPYPQPAP